MHFCRQGWWVGRWVVGSHVDPLVGKFGANQGEEDTSTLLLCSILALPLKQQLHTSDHDHQSATDRGTTCATRQPRGCTGWLWHSGGALVVNDTARRSSCSKLIALHPGCTAQNSASPSLTVHLEMVKEVRTRCAQKLCAFCNQIQITKLSTLYQL